MGSAREKLNLPPADMKRAWRIVTWAGLLGSSYYLLCVYGAPRIKFLTELKATASDFGLIAGLGALVLAFQVFGAVIANRLNRRKPLWMTLVIIHRLMFIGVLLAPALFLGERARIWWIILFLFLHDTAAQISVPMFMSWMADLVPQETMTRHWASRQRFITLANVLLMIVLAFGFHLFETRGLVITGFIFFASIGLVLGVADILLFFAVPEPPNVKVPVSDLKMILAQPLRDRNYRPFLIFVGFWHFGIFTSAPFFGLYMVDYLEFSVLTIQLLITSATIGVAVSSRFWGLMCDTYGYRPNFELLAIGKSLTPISFIVASFFPGYAALILAITMFFDGMLNGGVMLSIHGMLLRSTPRQNRTMYIAAANFVSIGVIAGLAPIIAGRLIDFLNARWAWDGLGVHITGYHVVFFGSAFLRFGAYPLAKRVREPRAVPLKVVIRQIRSRTTLGVVRWVYRLIESPHEEVRLRAARILGGLKHPLAIRELIQALGDESVAVREAATKALGRIGDSEAVEPLAEALINPNSGIASPAAAALGRIGGVDSLRALLANLRNADARTLGAILDSLDRINDSAAIVPLICLFNETGDEQMNVRIAATLGRLGETESTEAVLQLLRERRPTGQPRLLK
jgi:MFS family permease